ncbi:MULTISPECIES: Imm50 family immunity protein [unclassified Rhizobium]|uniref:Imm50 family immunity protein n=1 Tax=unclassified Rhizobium TaxID=2613769 RepID=UPI0012E39BD2|nr:MULTISPECIES: Imm50 family immunity protein [unclassified Rhizobium]
MKRMDEDDWRAIPGGDALIAYFGHSPMFHDGEITQVVLNRLSTSTISVHIWGVDDVDPVKHAVVTLSINDIIDLELENFSPQNVIGDVIIRPLLEREDRRSHYPRNRKESDIEIELIPIYGLNGILRAGSVSLTFVPGKPGDA